MTEFDQTPDRSTHDVDELTKAARSLPPIEDLYLAAREVKELLPRLWDLIPHRGTPVGLTGGASEQQRRRTQAPAPWSDPHALLYYEIVHEVQKRTRELRLLLFGRAAPVSARAGAIDRALSDLPVLIAHAQEKGLGANLYRHQDLLRIGGDLKRWPVQVRALLGEPRPDEIPWTKAPGDLVCPFCDQRLELPPGWATETDVRATDLVCRRCRDAHGKYLRFEPTSWLGLVLDDSDELTVAQAEEQLGVSGWTIRSWHRRGRLRPVGQRAGRRVYRRADLQALASDED
ncbi:MerR family transcriptional regulator [Pseudactinotalea suaedae]|uniref:MerR family transcriptional regulator n=1 Tax=Pseudactinotalea suaedae TaxID=1524924 RepID=UPI0019D5DE37|nr:helix-turn-helix domain-containing protein [Pseudactinotalea suaedae]